MKCLDLLFVLWCSGILAVTTCSQVEYHKCVTDYWDKITCNLKITGGPVQNSSSSYSLRFTHKATDFKNIGSTSCPLLVMNNIHVCDCKINLSGNIWSDMDNYVIELYKELVFQERVETNFNLAEHIQMKPLPDIKVQQTREGVNITLKSKYDNHGYLRENLGYVLSLQTSSKNKSIVLDSKTFHFIDKKSLQNAEYCVKAKYTHKNYETKYLDEWSKPVCWKNKAEEDQDNVLFILAKSLGPVCLIIGLLLFVFYSPAARMKIKTMSHTPSPAPFFQPLYQQHKGDLQEWLSPQGKLLLTHKAEITVSDAVAVVPKPIPKDPEEIQTFIDPPVMQLTFPVCQTSYVGLPGMDKAPPLVTVVCPGNTSYTQLPCSVWGVGMKEVEVSSCPPEDILELSCDDSGCSFEDVTQSPECSLPNSPVADSPAPSYCIDYCILNKTAEGVVPVLVSKKAMHKV